jgi:archaellum component FlaF (FlaF/FlaG flagellin family)
MNAPDFRTSLRRQRIVTTAVLLSAALVLAFGFAAHTARPSQEGRVSSEANERRFENTVPEHVPLKVKLKSEKSFKDFKNKGWVRELEIEVTNTGSKPIYYLYVVLVFPDVLVNGHQLTLRTTYGRKELGLPETPVEPDDVPVLIPGQSLTIKLPERKVRAYEQSRDDEGRPDPKTVEFEVQAVKFGDGTSFRGRKGMLWKEATKKQSSNAPRPDAGAGGCRPTERSKGADYQAAS